jgi:hypothetical protein
MTVVFVAMVAFAETRIRASCPIPEFGSRIVDPEFYWVFMDKRDGLHYFGGEAEEAKARER